MHKDPPGVGARGLRQVYLNHRVLRHHHRPACMGGAGGVHKPWVLTGSMGRAASAPRQRARALHPAQLAGPQAAAGRSCYAPWPAAELRCVGSVRLSSPEGQAVGRHRCDEGARHTGGDHGAACVGPGEGWVGGGLPGRTQASCAACTAPSPGCAARPASPAGWAPPALPPPASGLLRGRSRACKPCIRPLLMVHPATKPTHPPTCCRLCCRWEWI